MSPKQPSPLTRLQIQLNDKLANLRSRQANQRVLQAQRLAEQERVKSLSGEEQEQARAEMVEKWKTEDQSRIQGSYEDRTAALNQALEEKRKALEAAKANAAKAFETTKDKEQYNKIIDRIKDKKSDYKEQIQGKRELVKQKYEDAIARVAARTGSTTATPKTYEEQVAETNAKLEIKDANLDRIQDNKTAIYADRLEQYKNELKTTEDPSAVKEKIAKIEAIQAGAQKQLELKRNFAEEQQRNTMFRLLEANQNRQIPSSANAGQGQLPGPPPSPPGLNNQNSIFSMPLPPAPPPFANPNHQAVIQLPPPPPSRF